MNILKPLKQNIIRHVCKLNVCLDPYTYLPSVNIKILNYFNGLSFLCTRPQICTKYSEMIIKLIWVFNSLNRVYMNVLKPARLYGYWLEGDVSVTS